MIAIRNEIKEYHSFELFKNVLKDVKLKLKDFEILFLKTIKNQNKMRELKLSLITQGRDAALKIHEVKKANTASCDKVEVCKKYNIVCFTNN